MGTYQCKSPRWGRFGRFYLGTDQALEKAKDYKAIIHRLEDDDDKLVVMPKEMNMTDKEIERSSFSGKVVLSMKF